MAATEKADAPPRWQDDLYDALRRHGVTQFAYVPDAGHRVAIDRSLDGTRFEAATGWRAQPWPELVRRMHAFG